MDGDDQGPGGESARARALLPEAVVSAVGCCSGMPVPALHRGAPSPAVTLVFSLDEPIVTGSTPQQMFEDEAHTTHVDTVGFLRTAVYADGDRVAHAQLDWPEGGGIMLGSYQPDNEWSREPGTAGMYVVTADPDGLDTRLRAAVS